MDPKLVEDRALKKMLRPKDYMSDVAIPRAKVKRFPSNVSAKNRQNQSQNRLRRSASMNSSNQGVPKVTGRLHRISADVEPSWQRTTPIDIATLGDPPPPKHPVTRELSPSYSNRRDENNNNAINNQQQASRPQPLVQRQQSERLSRPTGGGSFLYSGNYDPNHSSARVITKPVPVGSALGRSASLNYGKNQERSEISNKNANKSAKPLAKNPMAAGRSMLILEEAEEENMAPTKFDNWADQLFKKETEANTTTNGKHNVKEGQDKVQFQAQKVQGQDEVDFKKPDPKKGKIGPGVNQIGPWALYASPSKKPERDYKNPAYASDSDLDSNYDNLKPVEKQAETPLKKGVDIDTVAVAELVMDPTAIAGGVGGKLGGKGGKKVGGMIGKSLGNEEAGEQLGEMAGEMAGEIVGDMAKDAAMDALGDLAAGGEIDIAPPEIPDASNLCAKCTIM